MSSETKDGAVEFDCATPAIRRMQEEPYISWFSAISTYLGYAVLVAFGHIRDVSIFLLVCFVLLCFGWFLL